MGTLEELVCGGYDGFAMTDRSQLPILKQITAGVHQLHSLRIVHGNLKPSNVLVSFPKGEGTEPMIKLADFGIRHAVRVEETGLTQFRLITTEGWMCPTDSQDPIEPPFDVFSLGCLFGFIGSKSVRFGSDWILCINNNRLMNLNFGQLEGNSPFFYLTAQMLFFVADKRPSASDVLNNPVFNQKKQLKQMPELEPLNPTKKNHKNTTDPLFISQPNAIPRVTKIATAALIIRSPVATAPSSSLNAVMRINKKYNCTTCGYQCDSKTKLSLHMNSHTGARPFQCGECFKSFSHPQTLYVHRKTHSPRQFQCEFCLKMFTLKWDRDLHRNMHTGIKPYECQLCHERFSRPNGLSQHRKNRHTIKITDICSLVEPSVKKPAQ